jgi:acetyltransferase
VVFASVSIGALSYEPRARRFVRRAGVPFLQGHRAAAAAVRALVDLESVRERAVTERPAHPKRAEALRLVRGRSGPLDEARAAAILRLYGVRRPRERIVATASEAASAARAIGVPVAVKVLAPEFPHKAEIGGVRLGLTSPGEVEDAAAEILSLARSAGARRPRVLVQRMASGPEVLVGAVVDERFGALVAVGPGGAAAEAAGSELALAPLMPRQAHAYAAANAERCGLDPRRHDVRALGRAVEAIARAAHDLRGRLASLEANPLVVGRTGAVAVDALAEIRPP